MIKVETGVSSESVNQSLRHTLFIEGERDSIDHSTMKELLRDINIKIEPIGPSYYVNSVAQALVYCHSDYYFLIDRDSQTDNEVEKSWNKFPDINESNLLIWRRKEFENYFLIPEFACQSEWFKGTQEQFIKKLEIESTKRIYLNIANTVIINVREKIKGNWIKKLSNIENFNTKDNALEFILSLNEFEKKKKSDSKILTKTNLKKLFNEYLELFLEGNTKCQIGKGKWLELMGGKELLSLMVNSDMFKVLDRNGNPIQKNKLIEVTKSLVKLDESKLPDDFKQLKQLLRTRLEV